MSAPCAGSFLVATPQLMDPNFLGTVVFLCEHGEEGSVGLVVNRALELGVSDVLPDQGLPADLRLDWGGPVGPDRIHALYAGPGDERRIEVLPGLQFGGDIADVKEALEAERALRLFCGYAGWESEQLDAEVAEGAWLLAPATLNDVLHPGAGDLWGRLVSTAHPELAWMRHIPPDPNLN